ncbi:unnamed protein product [Phytomonas sp. EM1]|nr:unnamed protein product [Phytomonas sp. EM1]|eukprot:CCW60634.1 unnamed protein product [Phytomonas sp. isolate EM1]
MSLHFFFIMTRKFLLLCTNFFQERLCMFMWTRIRRQTYSQGGRTVKRFGKPKKTTALFSDSGTSYQQKSFLFFK